MKTCPKCNTEKPVSEFNKDRSEKDGLQYRCKACMTAYHAANGSRKKSYDATYRAAHADSRKASHAASYAKNKETRIKYNIANKDRIREYYSAYRAANPGACRIHHQNRRARKLKNGGVLSKDLPERLFKLQRGKCACCHVSLDDGNHMDHVMPVALGGPNEDWNMQLLCQPCNLSKHAKHPVDFMQSRGYLL